MGDTSIEWTSKTWNPIRGCSVVSSGCKNCYAMSFATRFAAKGEAYEGLAYRNGSGAHWTGRVKFIEKHLNDPLRVRKPAKWFVNSMSDLFHESIPNVWIDKIFAVMALAPQHTFQVLTKRPERMRDYSLDIVAATRVKGFYLYQNGDGLNFRWPLANVWLGVSVEDQKTADERIPVLLETPAAVRWISYEPALGPVNFEKWLCSCPMKCEQDSGSITCSLGGYFDWLVCGGESGPGARQMDIAWARSIVEQCKAANVPVFVKQLGSYPLIDPRFDRTLSGWTRTLKSRKGSAMEEWPLDLRVREFPKL